MNKATEMVVGGFGGAIASEIMKLVIVDAKRVSTFTYVSQDFASMMEDVYPLIKKIESLQKDEEVKSLIDTIANARDLVEKCLVVQRWNLLKKIYYTRKIVKIQKEMVNFCQIQLPLLQHMNQLESMEETKKKLDILMKEINNNHLIYVKKFEDFMEANRVRLETKPGPFENATVLLNISSSKSMGKLPNVQEVYRNGKEVMTSRRAKLMLGQSRSS